MYGTRHSGPLAHLRRGVLAALAGFALTAQAQVSAPGMSADYWSRYMAPGMQRIEIGAGGRPIVTQGQPNLTTNNSPLSYNRTLVLRNPSNLPIEVVARTPVSSAQVARILRAGLRAAPVLGAGIALYDVARELGYTPSGTGDGLTLIFTDPNACTVAPCNEVRYTDGTRVTAWFSTRSAACAALAPEWDRTNSPNAPHTTELWTHTSGQLCRVRDRNGTVQSNSFPSETRTVAPSTGTPATLDQFEQAAAARANWPATSRLPQAVSDATSRNPAALDPATPTVTGPASSQGTSRTTQNPDGTTTTTTVTHNHTYNGPNVSTVTVTTVSVFNPTTNTTTTTTSTEAPPVPQDPQTQCDLYPNSLGCKELDEPPSEEIPRDEVAVTYAPESVNWGASASCPPPISIGTFAGGAHQLDFAPFCDVAERARPFVLAGAAMLAMMILVAGIRV